MIPRLFQVVFLCATGLMALCLPTLAAPASPEKASGPLPGIVEQPIGRSVSEGGHVTLSLSVTGAPPLDYQWWKNDQPVTDGVRIVGSTTAVLNIDPAQTNDTGSYFAVVTNANGAVTSAPVSILALQIGIAISVQGGTGLLVRMFGQIGDVYRAESANDVNAGPWITNAFATNYTGVTSVFVPFVGLRNFLRARFDHFRPVLYPPVRGDSTRVVRAYGKLNQVWQLQGTSNFQSWQSASSAQTNTTGWVRFVEVLPNNPPIRFYRLVLPSP